jgi:zinc transporter ZupT
VLGLWGAVTLASTLAALLGYLFLDGASGNVVAFVQPFAAGVLTMLASTMMPEAYEDGGPVVVSVVTTVGFLLAFVPEPRGLRDADGPGEVFTGPCDLWWIPPKSAYLA